ncbi:hypothetical protein RUND412_006709 [Rhizina undulata]
MPPLTSLQANQYLLDPLHSTEAWQEASSSNATKPPRSSHPQVHKSSSHRSSHRSENRPKPPHTRSHSHNPSSIPRPLEQIKRETRHANRAPHLKKNAIPAADTIDRLDNILGGIPYHHEGPFDATLRSRQIPGRAPVDAVKSSNEAALRATPRANIVDCLEKHKPLQGTAIIPPGMLGPGGEIMPEYEEYDLMRKDGNYKRWPGVRNQKYRDEDLKGKGEAGYIADEFDKQQKAARKAQSQGRLDEYELQTGPRTAGRLPGRADNVRVGGSRFEPVSSRTEISGRSKGSDDQAGTSSGLSGMLKKRFSLRRKKRDRD